jgi:hypothetical protein
LAGFDPPTYGRFSSDHRGAIETNGGSFARIVKACIPPNWKIPKELKIVLDMTREKISASHDDQIIEFSIDVCDDGVVCLKRDGKRVLIKEAAQLILDPFLFPELQPKDKN